MKNKGWENWAIIICAVLLLFGDKIFPSSSAPTMAVYVHESTETSVPNYVMSAFRILEGQGVQVRTIDDDRDPGDDPLMIAAADAGKAVAPKSLVLIGGDVIIRAVPVPKTEQGIIDEYNGRS